MTTPIIVVDDEPMIRHILSFAMDGLDHPVLPASDAEEALALMRANSPALVVCDVRLPGMNGVQLADAIKRERRWHNTAIVLISAFREPAIHVADRFVSKPFHVDRMAAVARDLLVQRSISTPPSPEILPC